MGVAEVIAAVLQRFSHTNVLCYTEVWGAEIGPAAAGPAGPPCMCLVGSYQIATKVSSFVANILLVLLVVSLLYTCDRIKTLSLSGLPTDHSNQCVKLKYSCTALITAWMGADSALKHACCLTIVTWKKM